MSSRRLWPSVLLIGTLAGFAPLACSSSDATPMLPPSQGGSSNAGTSAGGSAETNAGSAGNAGSASGGQHAGGGQAGTGGATAAALSWQPCAGQPPGTECATLQVPIDYGMPNSGTLGIAVSRIKASGTAGRLGVLLLNPGGPGAAGLTMPAELASVHSTALSRFDLIGFDPRGTGQSQPIACGYPRDSEVDPKHGLEPHAADLVARAAAYDQDLRAYAAACASKHGAFLHHVGTNDVARDMDQLRQALGEEQLSFLGFSYGTWLGARYALEFPTHVRAMGLDSVMLPEADLGLLDRETAQAKERELQRFDSACQANSQCALQAGGALTTIDALVTALWAKPLDVGNPKASLTAITLLRSIGFSLSTVSDWAGLAGFLAELSNTVVKGAPLAESTRAMLSDALDGPADDAFSAILCTDVPSGRTVAAVLDDAHTIASTAPHFWWVLLDELPCVVWQKPTDPVAITVTAAAKQLLLVGSEWDPATPYAWSERSSSALGGTGHVHNYADGHISYLNSPCTTQAIDAFLTDLTPAPASCGTAPSAPPPVAGGFDTPARAAPFRLRTRARPAFSLDQKASHLP